MRNKALSYPKSVCLESYSLCNGTCVFCPYIDVSKNIKSERMESGVVYRLIREIAEHGVERFSLFNNNEPILDDRLFDFLAYARSRMPNTRLTLSSNGKELSNGDIDRLLDSGLDRLFISIPALDPEAYEYLMGFHLDGVLNVITAIEASMRQKIRIAVPKTKYYDEAAFAARFEEQGIRVIVWDIEAKSNWKNYNIINSISDIRFGGDCDRPLDQAIISADGDVLICCRDWDHENVVGNIQERSLEDIWRSEKMKEIQAHIIAKEFSKIACCKTCSKAAGLPTTAADRFAL